MIVGFFISIITSLVGFILQILPVIEFPPEFGQALSTFWGLANSLSYIFPLNTLVQCLIIITTLHVSYWAYVMTIKIYKLVRGI